MIRRIVLLTDQRKTVDSDEHAGNNETLAMKLSRHRRNILYANDITPEALRDELEPETLIVAAFKDAPPETLAIMRENVGQENFVIFHARPGSGHNTTDGADEAEFGMITLVSPDKVYQRAFETALKHL
jgi:hypothetical protein